jgi:hypothetical protein
MTKRISLCALAAAASLLLASSVMAGDSTKISTDLSGYASYEAGQIMKGLSTGFGAGTNPSEVSHGWVETAQIGLYANFKIDENLKIVIGPEASLTTSFKLPHGGTMNNQDLADIQPLTLFSLGKGEALYSIGDPQKAAYQLEAGYFPYKYNDDARNFGEYMFRTNCYPTFFLNQFDRPYAYLLGFRAGNILYNNFHHDLILNSEITNYMPALGDFSLSYLADYKIPGILTIGGGISLSRVFSIYPNKTAPASTNTLLHVDNPQWRYDSTFHSYSVVGGDSVYQSFGGTKLMGRLSLDLAGIMGLTSSGLFKNGDIELYSELAILGLTNYTAYSYSNVTNPANLNVDTTHTYYNNLSDRMPLAMGFTFKAPYNHLDLINVELEYLSSKYPNDYFNAFNSMTPVPPDQSSHEKLKWSIYARKYLGTHVSIIAQFANDHYVPVTHANILQGGEGVQDLADVVTRHGDWWWVLKMKCEI